MNYDFATPGTGPIKLNGPSNPSVELEKYRSFNTSLRSKDDLNLNPTFAASVYNNNFRLYPNFDETDLFNFVSYGSLSKRLEVAVNNILNYFPAALDVRCTTTASTSADTAINISYDANEDETLLTIPWGVIRNPFNIDYRTNATVYLNSLEFPVSKYRNFTNKFRSYSLFLSGNSYELVSVQTTPNFTTDLTMYVKGNPFSGLTTFNQNFLVEWFFFFAFYIVKFGQINDIFVVY